MPKYRIPIWVSVAPVQTFAKVVEVEASSPEEAAAKLRGDVDPGNPILEDAIGTPGWKPVGGRMGPVRPDLTTYHHYLDERGLDQWLSAQGMPPEGPRREGGSGASAPASPVRRMRPKEGI